MSREYRAARNARKRGIPTGRRVGGPGLQGGPTGWAYRVGLQGGPTGWTYRMGLQGEAVGWAVRCKPIAPTERSAGLVSPGNAGAWGNRARRRVGGPGLQGGPTGWAYRVDLQGEAVGGAVRCKPIAPTGRSAGLVPPGNAGAWGNRAGRRVRRPGLHGGLIGDTHP